MAKKALLQGRAGNYRIRGSIWGLGHFAYRAYLHLLPARRRPDLSRSVVSADGMTMQEVLGAAKVQVKSTVGAPVEKLDVLPKTAPTPQPDTEHSPPLRQRHAPPLTD
jgi:hypothetical protein